MKFVIDHDFRNLSEDYFHRIGRTARSTKTDTEYPFFTPNNIKQGNYDRSYSSLLKGDLGANAQWCLQCCKLHQWEFLIRKLGKAEILCGFSSKEEQHSTNDARLEPLSAAPAKKKWAPAEEKFKEPASEGLLLPRVAFEPRSPVATCSDALISQSEFMGDYHTAPAKLCGSAVIDTLQH
ncbi:hypothetical protein U0070_017719 [Myodes glareolus]|uniref:Uncharacterized protein n=1 Tax=Myodes glareolus TaxID=447135 RepID=A0AAW0K6W3_MYOGA